MKKFHITGEQLQQLASILDSITVRGVDNCRSIAIAAQLVDQIASQEVAEPAVEEKPAEEGSKKSED